MRIYYRRRGLCKSRHFMQCIRTPIKFLYSNFFGFILCKSYVNKVWTYIYLSWPYRLLCRYVTYASVAVLLPFLPTPSPPYTLPISFFNKGTGNHNWANWISWLYQGSSEAEGTIWLGNYTSNWMGIDSSSTRVSLGAKLRLIFFGFLITNNVFFYH